jgi:hypothetical protein
MRNAEQMTKSCDASRVASAIVKAWIDNKLITSHIMPAPTALPSRKVTLRYPREELEENYQLLELPADILKQIEGKADAFP